MRTNLFLTLLLVACGPAPDKPVEPMIAFPTEWVDLTHAFDANTIYWPNNPTGFELDTQYNGMTPAGWYYSSN